MNKFFTFSFLIFLLNFSPSHAASWCGDSVRVVISSNDYNGTFSDKDVFHYDSLGREYQKQSYEWNGNFWALTTQVLTSYWNDSLPFEVITQSWVQGQWLTGRLVRKTYNNHGFQLSLLDSLHNPVNGYRNIFYRQTARDTADHVTQQTDQHWNGSEWINEVRYTYAYDSLGRDTLSYRENGDSISWKNYSYITYTFDAFGNSTGYTSLTWSGTQWNNQYKVTRWYYAFGLDTLEITLTGNVQSWNNNGLYRKTYDTWGNVTYELRQNGNGNSWTDFWQDLYYYTDSLVDSSIVQYWNSNQWISNNKIIYEYDSLGRLVVTTNLSFQNGEWVNYSRYVTYYLANGRIDYATDDYWSSGTGWETQCVYTPYYYNNGQSYYFNSGCYYSCSDAYSYDHYDADSIMTYSYSSYTDCGGGTYIEQEWYYYNEIHGDSVICDSGSAVLSVPACPGYTYLWDTGDTTPVITVNASGSYMVTIKNGTHQVYTAPFDVYILTDSMGIHQPDSSLIICGTGTATLKAPLIPFATYTWLVNGVLDTLSEYNQHPEWRWIKTQYSLPGAYQVIITTPCDTDTSSITNLQLYPATSVQITPSGPTSICPGDSVTLSATAGFVSYAWSITNDTSRAITVFNTGSYNVTATDTNGCVVNASRYVSVVPLPVMPLIVQDGPVLFIRDSASTNKWYKDSVMVQSGVSGTFLNGMNGWYYVEVYNTTGCRSVSPLFYYDSLALAVQAGSDKTICDNDSAMLGGNFPAWAGTPPYIYAWSPATGLNDPSLANPKASPDVPTTYALTVTDFTGTVKTDSVFVNVLSLPTPTLYSSTPHDICQGNYKQLECSSPGSQMNYWYVDSILVIQGTGNYYSRSYETSVTVFVVSKNAFQCYGRSADYQINVHPYPLQATLNYPSPVSLCGNDSILLVATHPDTNSTYQWMLGNQVLTGVNDSSVWASGNGYYNFVQTAPGGCAITASCQADGDSVFKPLVFTDRTYLCEGDSTRMYTAEIPGYHYEWYHDFVLIPGSDTSSIFVNASGEYVVYLSAPGGCDGHSYFTNVTVNPIPVVNVVRVNDTLTISPMVYGSYAWYAVGDSTILSIDPYFIPPAQGDYYVVVVNGLTDCPASSQAHHYLTCSASMNVFSLRCAGVCDGTLSALPLNGHPPYSFLWSTGDTTATIDSLCTGNYSCTMSDDSGCVAIYYPVITAPPLFHAAATMLAVQCHGDCTGSATAIGFGGIPPYHYAWSNGSSANSISNICIGQYNVTITDSNQCADTASVTVIEPAVLNPVFNGVDALCFGDCSGSFVPAVTGGTPPYMYAYCGGGVPIPGLCPGNYCVTVTDLHGCTASTTFTVSEPAALTSASFVHHPTCSGCNDGYIAVNSSGGTAPYTISWQPSVGVVSGDTIKYLTAGTYTVTVTDQHGCTYSFTDVVVDMPDGIQQTNEDAFQIYPNPVMDRLVIVPGGKLTGKIVIRIFDAAGKLLMENEIDPVATALHTAGLAEGVYQISIMSQSGSFTRKFVKISSE